MPAEYKREPTSGWQWPVFIQIFILIEKLGDSLSFLLEISFSDLGQEFFSYVYRRKGHLLLLIPNLKTRTVEFL